MIYAVLIYCLICVGLLTFAVVRLAFQNDEIERYYTTWYADENFYDDGK